METHLLNAGISLPNISLVIMQYKAVPDSSQNDTQPVIIAPCRHHVDIAVELELIMTDDKEVSRSARRLYHILHENVVDLWRKQSPFRNPLQNDMKNPLNTCNNHRAGTGCSLFPKRSASADAWSPCSDLGMEKRQRSWQWSNTSHTYQSTDFQGCIGNNRTVGPRCRINLIFWSTVQSVGFVDLLNWIAVTTSPIHLFVILLNFYTTTHSTKFTVPGNVSYLFTKETTN